MAKPARELKDHTHHLLARILKGTSLNGLGVDSPRMVQVLNSVVPVVQSAAERTDALYRAEDGSIWHVEYDMGSGHGRVTRWIRYHLAVAEHYPRQAVQTVIVWGRRRTPLLLRVQGVTLEAKQVCLRNQDGDARLHAWVQRGEPLEAAQALEVALLPWMGLRPPYGEKLRQILPLLAGMDRRRREGVVQALLAFTYERAPPEDWEHMVEVLDVMGLASKLWEDLDRKIRAEGRAEGQAEGRAQGQAEGQAQGLRSGRCQDVLDAFEARFRVVPAAVKRAVAQEQDAERLSVWLRGIIRATDEAEAVRIVTGAHGRSQDGGVRG